jgi:nucleobase:cation symporter-1, NCS1 family
MTDHLQSHDEPSGVGAVDAEQEAVFRSSDALGTDAVGKVEAHGIDVIPDEERHGKPSDLFSFWFGSNLIFTYLLFGGILIQLGLSLPVALLLAVVGNLVWTLVGVLSIPGPRTGTSNMVVSRAQYGFQGNKLSCFFSWVVNVGYEGVDFAIASLAAYSLADYAGWHLNTVWKAVILAVIIAVSFAVGLYGHATIFLYQKLFAWALGAAVIVFAVFLLPHVEFGYAPSDAPHGDALMAAVLIGISVVLSGPLSYPIGSDYSRYLPADSSAKKIVLYTALGGYIPTVVLTVTGILAATAVDASDFTTTIEAVVPGWFYPIFLLIIIAGMICNSILSVYSSGLALQALGVPLARSKTVWIDVIFGTALAVYGVLVATDFLTTLENFLLWSIYWYAPFFGVYLAELIFSRGWYNGHELHRVGGRYWFNRGFRWRGVAALVIGMVFAALTSNTPHLYGPISEHLLNGGDISAIGGFLVAGVAYYFMCIAPQRRSGSPERHTVPRQTTSA